MNNQPWLGIDIAKNTFHAALAGANAQPDQWASLPEAAFDRSRRGIQHLLSWLNNNGCSPDDLAGVCLEATGRYSTQWTDFAAQRLGPVSIVNPARPVAYAKSLGIRDKSDRVDACMLALYGKTMRPQPTPSPSKSQRALCELSRAYQTLNTDRQAYQQRLDDGPSCVEVRRALKGVITALKRNLLKLEEKIHQLIADNPTLNQDFKRAQTIPGIGPKTTAILLAEFGDLRTYKRNELVALAGLYPREYTSGTSVRKSPRLAKSGKSNVRAHLYMAAMNACRFDPRMRTFANRLLANGKAPMQMLAAVMRKLLLLVRTLIVNECDYDPNYTSTLQSTPA